LKNLAREFFGLGSDKKIKLFVDIYLVILSSKSRVRKISG
jgi:hypothetical protein